MTHCQLTFLHSVEHRKMIVKLLYEDNKGLKEDMSKTLKKFRKLGLERWLRI